MGFREMPLMVQLLVGLCCLFCLFGMALAIINLVGIQQFLGVLSYVFLITSMTQENIIKLRLWGACAGTCFVVQFALSDLPVINVIGQGGLVCYGIYKAYREIQGKKS